MAEWLSVAEAAAELNVDSRQVRNLVAHGALDGQRVGRAWLVSARAVADRQRVHAAPGRPLSASSAWVLLARIHDAVRDELGSPGPVLERRLEHRWRERERSLPEPREWSSWARRRGDRRRIWFHPGALDRIAGDERAVRVDLSKRLGLHVADLAPIYVAEADFESLLAEHHGQLIEGSPVVDEQDVVVVQNVPDDLAWRRNVDAAVLVDLADNRDARVSGAALDTLSTAASRLATAAHSQDRQR